VSGTFPWYIARAAGIVSWLLLAAATLWGLALSTRALGNRPRPNWLLDMHRWLGGTALAFTGVHVLALLADQYVNFGLTEVLVPFASSWHPVAVAWGVVAGYLLLAVELTSLARGRLAKRTWRRVHTASFVLFVFATIHALAAGTDTRSTAARLIVLAVVTLVAGFTAIRVIDLVRLPPVTATPVRPRHDRPARR
jgi:DMSO/TMAO reductase YedYZ heme-binding membrane subunit